MRDTEDRPCTMHTNATPPDGVPREDPECGARPSRVTRLMHGIVAAWIVLSALFFFARFSFTVFYAKEAAIRAAFGP